jgi:hypothetical protein
MSKIIISEESELFSSNIIIMIYSSSQFMYKLAERMLVNTFVWEYDMNRLCECHRQNYMDGRMLALLFHKPFFPL